MDSELLSRVDSALGDRLEALVRAHHRRRLARIGWGRALEPSPRLFADGEPPPRPGNEIEVLVDGANFLRAWPQSSSAPSRTSTSRAGTSRPSSRFVRAGGRTVLLDLLTELARRIEVRVLLSAVRRCRSSGPRAATSARSEGVRRLGVQVGLDPHERPLHCQHEKLVVVDDRVCSVGGIDLTTFWGDRLSTASRSLP